MKNFIVAIINDFLVKRDLEMPVGGRKKETIRGNVMFPDIVKAKDADEAKSQIAKAHNIPYNYLVAYETKTPIEKVKDLDITIVHGNEAKVFHSVSSANLYYGDLQRKSWDESQSVMITVSMNKELKSHGYYKFTGQEPDHIFRFLASKLDMENTKNAHLRKLYLGINDDNTIAKIHMYSFKTPKSTIVQFFRDPLTSEALKKQKLVVAIEAHCKNSDVEVTEEIITPTVN